MSRTEVNATTCSSDVIEIDAPPQVVWDVVADFSTYPEWNPFCVAVDGAFELGAAIVLHTPHPDHEGDLLTQEWISGINAPHHLQYNTGDSIQGVHAVRDQWIEDLGDNRSSYCTVDVFNGEFAQLAFDLQGKWVTDGFNALAHALKARAESVWRSTS